MLYIHSGRYKQGYAAYGHLLAVSLCIHFDNMAQIIQCVPMS